MESYSYKIIMLRSKYPQKKLKLYSIVSLSIYFLAILHDHLACSILGDGVTYPEKRLK